MHDVFADSFVATLVPALGHALLQFTWQGLVIGAIAVIALRLARDARPEVRYAIACMAMLACVVVPLVTVLLQLGGTASASTVMRHAMPMRVAGDGSVAANVDWLTRLDALQPRIVALWAAGASVFCLRTLLGIAWVGRMRALPQPPLQARWQATLDTLALRFDLQGVGLRLVETLDSPVAAGWWRPVVLLPVSVALRLPAPYVEALLAHELAHVRRHDYLVNLLQRSIEALLFFHPVTWWLSRRVRIERELIADRLAADAIGDPRRLARALAALSELSPHSPALPHVAHAAHGGHLMSRIQHLVKSLPRDRQPAGRIALPLLGVAAACIAFFAHAQIANTTQTAQVEADKASAIAAASAEAEVAKAAPAIAAAAAAEAAKVAPAIAAEEAAKAAPAMAAQEAARAQAAADAEVHMKRIRTDSDDHEPWALVRKNEAGYSMSGSTRDMKDIEEVKRAMQRDFVWFRHDGDAYVIDDPSMVSRAQTAWKDSDALGDQMEALGTKMEAHGKTMEAYGKQMEKLSAVQAPTPAMESAYARIMQLAEQQEALAGKQQLLAMKQRKADGAEEEKLDREMDALSAQMDKLGEQMEAEHGAVERQTAELQRQMAPMEALAKQMEAASKPMDELGNQMGKLGRQQEQLVRKAERELDALIAEAMKKGLAKPAPERL